MLTENQVREFKKKVLTTPPRNSIEKMLRIQSLSVIDFILQERVEVEF